MVKLICMLWLLLFSCRVLFCCGRVLGVMVLWLICVVVIEGVGMGFVGVLLWGWCMMVSLFRLLNIIVLFGVVVVVM